MGHSETSSTSTTRRCCFPRLLIVPISWAARLTRCLSRTFLARYWTCTSTLTKRRIRSRPLPFRAPTPR
uniref:Uncharacterized protein n=1 Tax=Hyaloperonospora arabidopsidis (strain Emoy2) TaxID=559515 RepID=M4B6V8_HYAAE